MKLAILHDGEGVLVAAMERRPGEADISPSGFVTTVGQEIVEIDVPDEYVHMSLAEICESLKVDTKGAQPALRPKTADAS